MRTGTRGLRRPTDTRHWLPTVCLTATLVFGALEQDTPAAWAFQEDQAGDDDTASTPVAGAERAASTGTPSQDGTPPQKKSFLTWMIEASGICGLLLLLMSFFMVALIMMGVLSIRRNILLPPVFIESFEQRLAAKEYQGAYDLSRSDNSLVARVLAAGLGKLNRGYNEAIEGMQEVGEDEAMALEHQLSYLSMIGVIAPMLGLLGTVQGMITSFEVIANATVSPKPNQLAAGISTALFTTLEGLIVAIPALVCYGILRNRVARFMLEVGIVSEGLMSRFSSLVRPRPAGGTTAAAAASTPQD